MDETDQLLKRAELNLHPGDLIEYRPVHADVAEPHRGRVDRVTDRGPVVLDEPPGMPLTHLVIWSRVIGRCE